MNCLSKRTSSFFELKQVNRIITSYQNTALYQHVPCLYWQLANSLVFLLYLLSVRPDWQRTIRSELPSCSTLTVEDLAAAPSVRAAISEAFRLLPTAPFLARLLETPMVIAGHKLPAGVSFLYSVMYYIFPDHISLS